MRGKTFIVGSIKRNNILESCHGSNLGVRYLGNSQRRYIVVKLVSMLVGPTRLAYRLLADLRCILAIVYINFC